MTNFNKHGGVMVDTSFLTVNDTNVIRSPGESNIDLFRHAAKKGWSNEVLAGCMNSQDGVGGTNTADSVAKHRKWLEEHMGLEKINTASPSVAKVRAKVSASVSMNEDGSTTVSMYGVTGEESKAYAEATPDLAFRMTIAKGYPAANFFEPGGVYFADFTKA